MFESGSTKSVCLGLRRSSRAKELVRAVADENNGSDGCRLSDVTSKNLGKWKVSRLFGRRLFVCPQASFAVPPTRAPTCKITRSSRGDGDFARQAEDFCGQSERESDPETNPGDGFPQRVRARDGLPAIEVLPLELLGMSNIRSRTTGTRRGPLRTWFDFFGGGPTGFPGNFSQDKLCVVLRRIPNTARWTSVRPIRPAVSGAVLGFLLERALFGSFTR